MRSDLKKKGASKKQAAGGRPRVCKTQKNDELDSLGKIALRLVKNARMPEKPWRRKKKESWTGT